MRGHEAIIQMRLRGVAPKFVFINDWPCKTDWFETGDHATISLNGEPIKSLDLRFLVGLVVSISSLEEKRAKGLLDACKRASCKTVAACHVQEDKKPHQQSGWVEVYRG